MTDIDAPLEKKGGEDEQALVSEADWKFYFMPAQATKLITGRCCGMSLSIGAYYCIQLVLTIGVVNVYSDADRFLLCNENQTPLEAADVFDNALLLLAIFHLIEWIKTTFLLTVVCVGINLMHVYYFLFWNTIFGVIAVVYTMIVVFSEEGQACSAPQ